MVIMRPKSQESDADGACPRLKEPPRVMSGPNQISGIEASLMRE